MSEDQFTGDFNVMLLIDNTARKVPIAKIDVDTPYIKGQVEAQCLPDAVYDLINRAAWGRGTVLVLHAFFF